MSPLRLRKRTEKIRVLNFIVSISLFNLMTATKSATFSKSVKDVLFEWGIQIKHLADFISQIETLLAKFQFISQYDPAGSYYFTILRSKIISLFL